jgi:flagellum-specific ATP synthase
MSNVTDKNHQRLAMKFREALALYNQSEDLINIGAYKPGSNPKLDYVISKMDEIIAYQKQDIDDKCCMESSMDMLQRIFDDGFLL